MVGSSEANLFASIAAGILALWGPLHGGANQEAIEMLQAIQADGGDIDKYVKRAKDPNDPFREVMLTSTGDLWKSGTRLDNYLTRYLRDANSYPTELLTGLRAIFEETVKLVWDVLGERAFWLWRDRQGKRGWVDRPTLIAYDAVMLSFSQYLGDQEELRRRKKEIVAALPSFYDEHYDDFDGRKTNATDIARRDSAMSMFLAKLIQG